VQANNVGKKSSGKGGEKRFLYSHEYRDQKMEEKKARNNFSRNTRIVRGKNVAKIIIGKVRKKRFL